LKCQVLFDLESPSRGLIVKAAIGFAESTEAYWPFDELNQMLAAFYNATMDLPQISAAIESGRVVGYLAMPRNSESQYEINRIFRIAMIESGKATPNENGYTFTQSTPFVVSTTHEGQPIALVAYQQPAGAQLPLEAVNYAITMLMGQASWPQDLSAFIYPVAKNGSPKLAGLWVGPTVDDMNNSPEADDMIFRDIRWFNYPSEASLMHRPAAMLALKNALSKYPDFEKKVFA
jgi:hypothetical protein